MTSYFGWTNCTGMALSSIRDLRRDRRAQDLIEYALLAGFIAVAVAALFPSSIAPDISMIMSKISSILALA